ncbi:lipoyl synthase [Desulfoscipio geothermicus]|uniref:Multifunctional fusion protein n=1 Tax=Desulfoscipio geothermicus DSM 3669 TaxID=1121426 RepID=A0A1I6D4J7_9FIRM|nr:lipoyl synthase [Desulfoscipio geothermicus]SFR00365.1 lipoic acid synthetase [Desulfoscipio geothermicus DSM 3669]
MVQTLCDTVITKYQRALVIGLDTLAYPRALELQRRLQRLRIAGEMPDCMLCLEHPPTLTLGRAGGDTDILVSGERLAREGVEVYRVERGGGVTYHGPGQLVGYPIVDLNNYQRDVHLLVQNLEEVIIRALGAFGIKGRRKEGYPGVWVDEAKIASIGVAVSKWVTMHGFALNVDPQMSHFKLINPCGMQGVRMTSMRELLGRPVGVWEVKDRVIEEMAAVFRWAEVLPGTPAPVCKLLDELGVETPSSRPGWLGVQVPAPGVLGKMVGLLERGRLNTVCREARCPNVAECFGMGTATFMVLGDACTRNCRFCSVNSGPPREPDLAEPQSLAETVRELGLRHAVVTSVTRDDLPDGGAGHFARVISAVRRLCPGVTVEVLVPDFGGSEESLATVVAARPDILGHNLETVPRLYEKVRPGADYRRSLQLLASAKRLAPGMVTKSGIMVGLGEEPEEMLGVMDDLKKAGCDYVTIGQYLQPTPGHLPVQGFVTPAMFDWYREQCLLKGFRQADCGPLVRSSYHARPLA